MSDVAIDLVVRAGHCLDACRREGVTLAFAESLTGGLVAATFTAVPGASDVVVGGLVAYATRLKTQLLGVDVDLLDRVGPVDPEVAIQMARGVAIRLVADIGVSCTGVAGPDPQDGHQPGTVHVGVHRDGEPDLVRSFTFTGDRAKVRESTVGAVIDALQIRLNGPGAAVPKS